MMGGDAVVGWEGVPTDFTIQAFLSRYSLGEMINKRSHSHIELRVFKKEAKIGVAQTCGVCARCEL